MNSLQPIHRVITGLKLVLRGEKLRNLSESSALVRLLIVIYSIGFSSVSVVRYYGLQTFAWDLGIYNQAMHTTLFSERLLYYTADLPSNPTGSLLGVHFSPILLAMLPLYMLDPSPITLLVVQAVALGLGALPLYYYALNKLGERRTPVVFAVAYLLSPMIVGMNWFDFHPEAFLPPALLGALYFSSKQRWISFFACVLVALASIEAAPVLVAAIGLYLFWVARHDITKRLWPPVIRSSAFWVPTATLLLSAGWMFVALTTIRSFNSSDVFYFGGSPLYFGVLGAQTISEVPILVLSNPASAVSALLFDWWLKILYLAVLFAPLLFLSFRYPPLTLLTLPWLGVALLSNYLPFYFPANQYPSFVAPFIFLGAVEGLKRLKSSGRTGWYSPQRIWKRLLVATVISFFVATPMVPWFAGVGTPPPPYGVFSASSHEGKVVALLTLIPSDASVLTQSNVFPLVSSRVNAFVVPTVSFFPTGTSFNQTLDAWLNVSEYVFLDPVTDQISTLLTLPRMRQMAVHGLLAQVEELMLFKRSYTGSPIRFEPMQVVWNWMSLKPLNAVVVSDVGSSLGKALFHEGSAGAMFWNSSEVWLPPGSYQATLQLRTGSYVTGDFLRVSLTTLSVRAKAAPIGTDQTGFNYRFSVLREISSISSTRLSSGVEATVSYQNFTISFISNGLQSFGLAGEVLTSSTGVYLDYIVIEQVST